MKYNSGARLTYSMKRKRLSIFKSMLTKKRIDKRNIFIIVPSDMKGRFVFRHVVKPTHIGRILQNTRKIYTGDIKLEELNDSFISRS